MRELRLRVFAYPDAGRNSLENRPLGGADERMILRPETVRLEIDRQNDADPALSVHPPFDEGHASAPPENALRDIAFDCGIDCPNTRLLPLSEPNLREGAPKRGGLVPHEGFKRLPVFGFARVLVAGNRRPARQIDAGGGQQNFRSKNTTLHISLQKYDGQAERHRRSRRQKDEYAHIDEPESEPFQGSDNRVFFLEIDLFHYFFHQNFLLFALDTRVIP